MSEKCTSFRFLVPIGVKYPSGPPPVHPFRVMALPLSKLTPEVFYNDTVTTTNNGLRVVYVSSIPRGGPDDKFTFLLSYESVDPCNDEHLAMLPESPFGWSPVDPTAGRSTVSVELSPDMVDFFSALDSSNKDAATCHSDTWFKKPMTATQVAEFYVPLVRPPPEGKEDKFKPLINIKVQSDGPKATKVYVRRGTSVADDGSAQADCYDGSVSDIRPKTKMLMVCEMSMVWMMASSKQWGMSVSATEITVWPQSGRPRGLDAFGFVGSKVKKVNPPKEEDDDFTNE